MPQSSLGLHHQQKRKRVYGKLEKYPHPNKFKRSVDTLIYVLGVVVPIFTIPQAMQIWLSKTAEGVSSITWIVYLINTIIWTIYGIIHKEKPIILTFSFMTVINIIIVLGIILYS